MALISFTNSSWHNDASVECLWVSLLYIPCALLLLFCFHVALVLLLHLPPNLILRILLFCSRRHLHQTLLACSFLSTLVSSTLLPVFLVSLCCWRPFIWSLWSFYHCLFSHSWLALLNVVGLPVLTVDGYCWVMFGCSIDPLLVNTGWWLPSRKAKGYVSRTPALHECSCFVAPCFLWILLAAVLSLFIATGYLFSTLHLLLLTLLLVGYCDMIVLCCPLPNTASVCLYRKSPVASGSSLQLFSPFLWMWLGYLCRCALLWPLRPLLV